jgi:phosphate transport system substrate-binding protein
MPRKPQDPVAAARALEFFAWAFEKGDKMAEELDFVPMPDNVVKLIKNTWAQNIATK